MSANWRLGKPVMAAHGDAAMTRLYRDPAWRDAVRAEMVASRGRLLFNGEWDKLFVVASGTGGGPHKVKISPYDPQRHVWVVNDSRHVIYKFTNDGKELVLRLRDPNPRGTKEEVLAHQPPGPLDFGQNSTLTFLPNGDFLLGDGYWNGRIARGSTGTTF